MVDHAAATVRREDMLVRFRLARPDGATQKGNVFVDSYAAANRGIVSQADLAGRSYALSGATWLRGMRETAAARASTARAALPLGESGTAETVFCVAKVGAPGRSAWSTPCRRAGCATREMCSPSTSRRVAGGGAD